jgi:serine protease Do
MRKNKLIILINSSIFVVTFIVFAIINYGGNKSIEENVSASILSSEKNVCEKKYDLSYGYADLVDDVISSVVNISTSRVDEQNIDMFQGFGFLFDMPQMKQKVKRRSIGLGSGFFIDQDGHVVTNYHVIQNASEIKITTHDMKEYPAKVVSFDEKLDLAVLKANIKNKVNFVKFGKSSNVRIGDRVLAIGNPFGFGGSVTSGIISGKSRHLADSPYANFIQTDASINKGNSGGPMFNMCGDVIGINTAIVSTSGGSIGIGFAVASDIASPAIEKLKKKEKIERGWIGVEVQQINDEMAEAVGLKNKTGIFVNKVSKGSPAEIAGIKQGDIITKFNGEDVKQVSQLPGIVASINIGTNVPTQIFRSGKYIDLNVKIQKVSEKESKVSESETLFGLVISSLNDGIKAKAGAPSDMDGVVVQEVKNQVIMEFDAIRVGDIIISINQTPIKSVSDVKTAYKNFKSSKRKNAVFQIYRSGAIITVATQIE